MLLQYSIAGALLALCFAFVAASTWYVLTPVRLTIALPPGAEANALRVFAQALANEKRPLRLKVVPVADFYLSGELLENGMVDLAVVQPDITYPANAGTVALLRQEPVVLVVPSAEKGQSLSQLVSKNIVVLTKRPSDLDVIRQILSYYEIRPSTTSLRSVSPEEMESGKTAGRIDAMILIVTPGTKYAQRLMQIVMRWFGDSAWVLPLEGAEILVRKLPDLNTIKLPPGALVNLPKEEVKTIGRSYRLVASNALDRGVVSSLTELLFRMRAQVARLEPAINLMEAPDEDSAMTSRLPNHPGAVDYLHREQVTFMTRYGDWIWLGLFAGGGITSFLGWLAQVLARKRREAIDSVLDRLLIILSEARQSNSISNLNELALEIDALVTRAVRLARTQTTSTRTMGSLIVALEGARAAVADRRRELFDERAAGPGMLPFPYSVSGQNSGMNAIPATPSTTADLRT